ncbi:hypothetical protein [Candidatus Hodarchaeum mangrovi]
MKIHCDSNCRPCVLEGGPSRDITDNFIAFFCPTCRSAFFCEVGVVRHFSISNEINFHSCIDCGAQLIRKPLDEVALEQAKFLMDNTKLSKSGKFRASLLPIKEQPRATESLSLLYETKSISAFNRSLITEMSRISGLTPQVISNFAREFGVSENIINNLSGDSETILITLATIAPKFIEVLHSNLLGGDNSASALALRFSVFANNIPGLIFIQPAQKIVEAGPFDLIAYDSQGMRIWVFCIPGVIDSIDIEKIVGPLLNQDPDNFYGVSKIFLVTQGFSWVTKQILKKYKGIVVSESENVENELEESRRTILFDLWQEKTSMSKYDIIFENIVL